MLLCSSLPGSSDPPPGRPTARALGRSPAEVQQGPGGGRGALCRPAEEVELRERARLLGLHVLQVEAPHQEVLAPDVLRHEVHLRRRGCRPESGRASPNPPGLPGQSDSKSSRKLTQPPTPTVPAVPKNSSCLCHLWTAQDNWWLFHLDTTIVSFHLFWLSPVA